MHDDEALAIFEQDGWTLSAQHARRRGLHWDDLYRLRDSGQIIELTRGIYRSAAAPAVEHIDLVAITARNPITTACLATALSFWDLTDDIPGAIHVAVPRGTHPPRFDWPPVKTHVFAAGTFELERKCITLPTGEQFHVYGAARSIADAIRLGKHAGTDSPASLIKRYLKIPGNTPAHLLDVSRTLGCEGIARRLLEVIIE